MPVGNYQEIDEPALIPHIAEASSSKYPYEVLFRSLHKLLMDTATSEYCGVCSALHAVFEMMTVSPVVISILTFFCHLQV